MTTPAFTRLALGTSAAAALLVGCGGWRSPTGALGMLPQTGGITARIDQERSWMLPQARSEDLLYISDYYGVHIFSYPKVQHVGDIYGFASPAGLCSNQSGDVFVTDTQTYHVYEYAHGSTKRLKTLYDNYVDFNPVDCSVDLNTGDVATASLDAAFVVIFPKAKEVPKVYYDRHASMYHCAYDDKGDLFVDQISTRPHNYIGELAKGKTTFRNYLLDGRIAHSGGIQFDGQRVAIEDLKSLVVYRLSFSGNDAIVVGTTPLMGAKYLYQYSIQRKALIGPDLYGDVYFWKYPKGGSPVSAIQGFTDPYGSTISAGH